MRKAFALLLLSATLSFAAVTCTTDYKNYLDASKELEKCYKKAGKVATADEVKKALSDTNYGWSVIDVRSRQGFDSASIEGSTFVGKTTAESLANSPEIANKNVIIVCKSVVGGVLHAPEFEAAGFNIKIFSVTQYAEAGYPLHSKVGSLADSGLLTVKGLIWAKKGDDFLLANAQQVKVANVTED